MKQTYIFRINGEKLTVVARSYKIAYLIARTIARGRLLVKVV